MSKNPIFDNTTASWIHEVKPGESHFEG